MNDIEFYLEAIPKTAVVQLPAGLVNFIIVLHAACILFLLFLLFPLLRICLWMVQDKLYSRRLTKDIMKRRSL